jgi:arylsulfatase A-like enzyme
VLPLAALVLVTSCRGKAAEGPLSGVLITLDTTRADALSCYGRHAGVTPELDELARESLRFEQAQTVAPITLPAHASMLTGLIPPRHSVRDNGLFAVPQSASTLAERAGERGFETAAFVSAAVLSAPWGLSQGFDVYDGLVEGPSRTGQYIDSRVGFETVARAKAWLAKRDRSRPFFLWVHLFDAHAPFQPAPQYLAQVGGRHLYLAEVAQMDAAVGQLVDGLRSSGDLDRSLVVVVGDHGEMLGAHGEETHSILCYQEVLRVPLLVRMPDGARAGTVEPRVVSVADVYPTFVQALGLGAPGDVDGRSLLDAARPAEAGAYFESYAGFLNYGWSPIVGWIAPDGKFLHGTRPELYDLRSDPQEARNLFDPTAPFVARAHEAITALAARPALAPDASSAIGERQREEVRRLGYAGAGDPSAVVPTPLTPTGLSDARDSLDELARFYEAMTLGGQGKRAEAIPLMRAVVDENPGNTFALNVLAGVLNEDGAYREALEVLQRIPPERRDRLNVQDCMGHALEGLGAPLDALPHFERALELKPGDPHQIDDVARVLEKLGRAGEAAAVRATASTLRR